MYLGVDLGTTNIKTLVVDADGRVVSEGSAGIERYCTPDGGVEQDLEEIWDATCKAIRQAIDEQNPLEIDAIGISSQGAAMQLLDAEEQPVGRVISWLDGRGRPFDQQITEELGEDFFIEHIGRDSSTMTIGQILRLSEEAPADFVLKKRRIAYVGDCMVGRLCGRRAHDATSLSIAGLLNPSLGRADPEVLELLKAGEDRLPDLAPATTPAGKLLPDVASQIGLAEGTPVSVAIHDQYAASLGVGSVGEGDVCLGTGTAWAMVANTTRLARPVTQGAFVCPHPVEGIYGQMLSMVNGGSSIDWALGLVGEGRSGPRSVDDRLEAVPPRSEGLRFWPLLSPSAAPGPFGEAGGRLAGIRLAHSADHLIRAVVEGLACELARHLRMLTDAGLPVRRLVMCGGAAASRVTPQIVADMTDRPVACVSETAPSAFGAATIARALVEPDQDLAELARKLAPASRTVEPGENRSVYRELLEKYLEPFAEGP
jgi:xylulokinase